MNIKTFLIFLSVVVFICVAASLVSRNNTKKSSGETADAEEKVITATETPAPVVSTTIPTEPNLKVAFIGDTGIDENATDVLELIKREGAHAVIHSGDLDYTDSPASFDAWINSVLGPDFPYFYSVGNHDVAMWRGIDGYRARGVERMKRIGLTDPGCIADYGNKSVCGFKGLEIVLSGIKQFGTIEEHERYLSDTLDNRPYIWKLCSWHEQMRNLTLGEKVDSVGYRAYDICKDHGAFIVNGHGHVYGRTRTLTDFSEAVMDPEFLLLDELRVQRKTSLEVGSSFLIESDFVKQRPQTRCFGWPTKNLQAIDLTGEDCHIWAQMYSSKQKSVSGVLFITFHINGDPYRASGYFKNLNNEIIDEFIIMNTIASN